jgi:hypothetical protein
MIDGDSIYAALEGIMSQFLETLKARLADAQQRLQVAQTALQKAQVEQQAVMQEYASWQNAVAVETRREQQQNTPTLPPAPSVQTSHVISVVATPRPLPQAQHSSVASADVPEINKSHLIRSVLRQHPNGITPADVWREVKDQVGRAYVYSVLKRLKDKKQASERRGKYYLLVEVKPEDGKENQSIVN